MSKKVAVTPITNPSLASASSVPMAAMDNKSVKSVFSPSRIDNVGGVSNTPCSRIKDLFVNVCIDYLKVTFVGKFSLSGDSDISKLMDLLFIDTEKASMRNGASGYNKGYDLDEGLSVFYGGAFTQSDGKDTWLLDMKGSACRHFEERVAAAHPDDFGYSLDWQVTMAWDQLVHYILKIGGSCTRIDLPVDDFSGIVPFDGLKQRCEKRSYVSNMRTFSLVPSFEDTDPGVFHLSRHKGVDGWTFTMGSRETCQLCIYDKKAEREVNAGAVVLVPSWIRYESRFYHGNAVEALNMLAASFGSKGGIGDFIVSVLKSMASFRGEDKPYVGKNIRLAPVWSAWSHFLEGYDTTRVISQARAESTVETNARWLDDDASKALARLVATSPNYVLEYYRYLLNTGVSKLEKKDLFSINNARRLMKLPLYKDLDDCVSSLIADCSKDFDVLADSPSEVIKLFKNDALKNGSSRIRGFKNDSIPDDYDDGGMYGDLERMANLHKNNKGDT